MALEPSRRVTCLCEQERHVGRGESHSRLRHFERRTTPVPLLAPGVRRPFNRYRGRRLQKRNIQAREVRARLDRPWAQTLLKLGYPKNLIGAVIADHFMYEGDDFKTFDEFLWAVIEASDMGDTFPVERYTSLWE